ncbi:MAG: DinB family protein [Ferruginibacter sp.]
MEKIYKPTGDYPSFYRPYMDGVPNDGELIRHLKDIQIETEKLIAGLSEEKLHYSYSIGKWTIKDILVHLSDCERIIIYRAMRIARADKTELPGFDEDLFAANANANKRKVNDMIKELSAFRAATVVFIETLDEASLDRTGTANGYPLSARLLVNHIYGHHRHHLNIIRERYL